jgi:hypothetical protein
MLSVRSIQSLPNVARSILEHPKFPKNYWSEAIREAILILNNIPKKGEQLTPNQNFSLKFYKSLCCKVLYYNPHYERKSQDRALEGVHLFKPLDPTENEFNIFSINAGKIVRFRDIF